MFAYEQELRIVLSEVDEEHAWGDGATIARVIEWDPETYIQSIRVHPEADESFMEVVSATVANYAPALKGSVAWSDMNARPPI